MGFPAVYDIQRPHKNLFLVILRPWINFWVKLEVVSVLWLALSIGFVTIYDNHSYKHPFWVIFAPGANFWVRQKVVRVSQSSAGLKTFLKW